MPFHPHLPKPLHGWREFLGEVGIIVIGVLIALGAEQGVEAVHHRSQVHTATEKLRAESIENRKVIEFDLGSLRNAIAEVDEDVAALNNCRRPRTAKLRPLSFVNILVPSDKAWTGIRDRALLPLMPDQLADGYWKIQATVDGITGRSADMDRGLDRANGALGSLRGGATDPAICDEALLALNQLKEVLQGSIAIDGFFELNNERAIRGEVLDATKTGLN